jgi:hypothetical protein
VKFFFKKNAVVLKQEDFKVIRGIQEKGKITKKTFSKEKPDA